MKTVVPIPLSHQCALSLETTRRYQGRTLNGTSSKSFHTGFLCRFLQSFVEHLAGISEFLGLAIAKEPTHGHRVVKDEAHARPASISSLMSTPRTGSASM